MATAFEVRPIAVENNLCNRYYYRIGGVGSEILVASGQVNSALISNVFSLPTKMRTTPGVNKLGTWTVNNCGQPVNGTVSQAHVSIQALNNSGSSVAVYTFFQSVDANTYFEYESEL